MDLPERIFEYNAFTVLAVTAETPRHQPRPAIRTTVALLSGREKPWPVESLRRRAQGAELTSSR